MEQLHYMLDNVSLEVVAYAIIGVSSLLAVLYFLNGSKKGGSLSSDSWLEDMAGVSRSKRVALDYKCPLFVGRVSTKRKNTLHLVIPQSTVGRMHAVIDFHDGAFWIADQSSTNGTFINGKKVVQPYKLNNGDVVMFHQYPFRFVNKIEVSGDKTVVAGATTLDEATEIAGVAARTAAAAVPQSADEPADEQYEDALNDLVGDQDDLGALDFGGVSNTISEAAELAGNDEDLTLDNFIDDKTMTNPDEK